jgi:hypothetical protein
MQPQQQQQSRNYVSLDRRRGTLGAGSGGSNNNNNWRRFMLPPNHGPRAVMVWGLALVAALAVFGLGIVWHSQRGRSGGDGHQNPQRFFLKMPRDGPIRGRDAAAADAARNEGEEAAAADDGGGGEEGGGAGAAVGGAGHNRRHVYHPGFDLEAWRARVHHEHGPTFQVADGASDYRTASYKKRRISDALEEIHRKKQEEMVRAVQERLDEQKVKATNLFHRRQQDPEP